jgi:hypothetical protein
MTTPHKHADLLRAIAEGETIQFYSGGYWVDVETSRVLADIGAENLSLCRIKPATRKNIDEPVLPKAVLEAALDEVLAERDGMLVQREADEALMRQVMCVLSLLKPDSLRDKEYQGALWDKIRARLEKP